MKCITHLDVDAVATCPRCNATICQECTNGTFYKIDNKPLCKKCNYEVGMENDHIFKSFLRGKQIKLVIFTVTFFIGIILFISSKTSGLTTFSSVTYMLFCWGLGFIGNFFDKKTDTRSVKTQMQDAITEIKHPIAAFLGKILGFFIMAVSSPIQIVALLIGIAKVKKQITDNTNILNMIVNET